MAIRHYDTHPWMDIPSYRDAIAASKTDQVAVLQQKRNFRLEGSNLCQLNTFEMIDFKPFY